MANDDKTSLSFSRWQIIAILLAAFVCGAVTGICAASYWPLDNTAEAGLLIGLLAASYVASFGLAGWAAEKTARDESRHYRTVADQYADKAVKLERALLERDAQLAAAQSQPRPDAMALLDAERKGYARGYSAGLRDGQALPPSAYPIDQPETYSTSRADTWREANKPPHPIIGDGVYITRDGRTAVVDRPHGDPDLWAGRVLRNIGKSLTTNCVWRKSGVAAVCYGRENDIVAVVNPTPVSNAVLSPDADSTPQAEEAGK